MNTITAAAVAAIATAAVAIGAGVATADAGNPCAKAVTKADSVISHMGDMTWTNSQARRAMNAGDPTAAAKVAEYESQVAHLTTLMADYQEAATNCR